LCEFKSTFEDASFFHRGKALNPRAALEINNKLDSIAVTVIMKDI